MHLLVDEYSHSSRLGDAVRAGSGRLTKAFCAYCSRFTKAPVSLHRKSRVSVTLSQDGDVDRIMTLRGLCAISEAIILAPAIFIMITQDDFQRENKASSPRSPL
ncbi:hypothetical protein LX32DRAFT_311315 [Colletotrichum zoysiae]|uniref:Uncharacterized protein n=1 Tax=Colletotrichum zoysiae TaxID=1216348 RepID=A0AAD9HKY0_9PEZI|nr:hypothetical protein LX32DRAFT_311315 [Colletotrichum zoysiae]